MLGVRMEDVRTEGEDVPQTMNDFAVVGRLQERADALGDDASDAVDGRQVFQGG